jgi:glycosyltransferase involved in cell wall biosynthesis
MRILHVQSFFDLGGSESMILELAKQQRASGHDVSLCALYGPGPCDEKAAAIGFRINHLNSKPGIRANVKALSAFLRSGNYDVVHSHWGVWLATALAGFLRRIPRVHTHHANQQRRLFMEHRVASFFTTKVVVLTPQIDDYIKSWVAVPARKIVVIPNGIEQSKIEDAERVEIEGIAPDQIVVGMVARLSPPKDYSTFIRAAKIVTDKMPDVHFVSIGTGRDEARLRGEVAALGIDRFHFLGGRLDVPSLLHRMSIKVLATKNEGLSISLLEAMVAKCVCIASDIPSNRFTLDDGNAGILVPFQDHQALATAIEQVLTNPELSERLRNAAFLRGQYFNSRRMADAYLNLYAELVPQAVSHQST